MTAACLAASTLAPSLSAQDVTYTSVSEMELGGALGRLLAVGMGDGVRETTYLQASRMRTDTERASVIWDFEADRMVTLNHDARQYTVMDLARFRENMAAMATAMSEGAAQPGVEPSGDVEPAEREAPAANLNVTIRTDRTGERRDVAGLASERVFLTLEMEGEVPPEEEGEESVRTSMVFLMDLWITQDFPRFSPFADDEELRESMREAWAEQSQALSDALAQNPDIQAGLDRTQAELEALEGTVMQGTTHLVVVPDGVQFDRAKVLASADKSLSSAAAGAAGAAAAESARGAARGLGRRLGGVFGGGGDDERQEAPEPEQRTILRVKTLITEVSWDGIAPEVFEVPEGYTEIEWRGMGG
ncbi:MAG TPA: hypothetical protein VGA70_05155 [Longimicrobiales bacterium]